MSANAMVRYFYRRRHGGGCLRERPYTPEWGSLDILGACGALDLGSNPSSGANSHI